MLGAALVLVGSFSLQTLSVSVPLDVSGVKPGPNSVVRNQGLSDTRDFGSPLPTGTPLRATPAWSASVDTFWRL
jgi:hypothetical protein